MDTIIITVVELIVLVVAFLIGRYVVPKISSDAIADITAKTSLIVTYADKFVAWAKQFLSSSTGSEKMEAVVEKLAEICQKYDIDMTEDELTAIAQKAYDSMKAGEESAATAVSSTPTVVINNGAPVETTTEPTE